MPELEKSVKCVSRRLLQYLGTLTLQEKADISLEAISILTLIEHAVNPAKFYKVELPPQDPIMKDGAECPLCKGFTGILVPVTSTRMGTQKTGGQMYTCTASGCNRMWPY